MVSDFDADVSSEDENLSVVKRKATENVKLRKKSKYCDDTNEEPVMSQVLVKVEMEEIDEDVVALDYSMANEDPLASTSNPKNHQTHPCTECESVFESSVELRSHALEHRNRHKCDVCGRCFSRAYSLKLHKKTHAEEQFHKCPLCDEAFIQKVLLARHLAAHAREHRCGACAAAFHTAAQLRAHRRTHRKRRGRKPKKLTDSENTKKVEKVKAKPTRKLNGAEDNKFDNYLKREELSHEIQCAIVSKMYKGRCINDICRLYRVTPEVINEIWEERDKYTLAKINVKEKSRYLNKVVDTRILDWLNDQRAKKNHVTGQMVQDIGEEIAQEIGFIAFNGSKKWLDRFKTRYKITLRTQHIKRDLPSAAFDSKWKKAFFKEQWCDARVGFTDDNIYVADEVGLYINPSKGRIKKQAGKKFIHGYVKDRLSILMCTNVTGTDKKKLLVCGFEDPLIHSHRDPDTLPVNYIRHSQAHFTTKMFEEYVKYWNSELKRLNRKALLIIDRATIHTKMQTTHLRLCFVPWKASVGLIPIRNGVYAKFRDEFRRLLLEDKAINVLKGVDRNLTCMEALYMMERAWERTPPEVITNSFISTGYDVQIYESKPIYIPNVPKVKDNDEEEICQMLKDFDVDPYFTDLSHLDMYLTVDEDLVTGQGTNFSVFGGNHKIVDPLADTDSGEILPISTDKPQTSERENTIKMNRAMEDLEIVMKHLRSTDTSYKMYCNFMEIENFLYKMLSES